MSVIITLNLACLAPQPCPTHPSKQTQAQGSQPAPRPAKGCHCQVKPFQEKQGLRRANSQLQEKASLPSHHCGHITPSGALVGINNKSRKRKKRHGPVTLEVPGPWKPTSLLQSRSAPTNSLSSCASVCPPLGCWAPSSHPLQVPGKGPSSGGTILIITWPWGQMASHQRQLMNTGGPAPATTTLHNSLQGSAHPSSWQVQCGCPGWQAAGGSDYCFSLRLT